MNHLKAEDPVAPQIVEYLFSAGFTLEQTAAALQLSRRAVSDNWSFARAWLLLMLEGESGDNPRWTAMLSTVHS